MILSLGSAGWGWGRGGGGGGRGGGGGGGRRRLQLVGGEGLGRLAVEVDTNATAQHVEVADPADAVGGRDPLAHLGERRRGLDVGGVLVDQAALQPTALPRNLGRCHRQVLVLGHLD